MAKIPINSVILSLALLEGCHVSAINVEDCEIWGEGRSKKANQIMHLLFPF